jgi:hypothetical protein
VFWVGTVSSAGKQALEPMSVSGNGAAVRRIALTVVGGGRNLMLRPGVKAVVADRHLQRCRRGVALLLSTGGFQAALTPAAAAGGGYGNDTSWVRGDAAMASGGVFW